MSWAGYIYLFYFFKAGILNGRDLATFGWRRRVPIVQFSSACLHSLMKTMRFSRRIYFSLSSFLFPLLIYIWRYSLFMFYGVGLCLLVWAFGAYVLLKLLEFLALILVRLSNNNIFLFLSMAMNINDSTIMSTEAPLRPKSFPRWRV